MNCDVCGKPIEHGYVHHVRLNANVHPLCPMTNVKGEDITMHCVQWRHAGHDQVVATKLGEDS